MNPKEYIINVLGDLSRISNKIRIDMLKNILELPLLMYIDNVGDWIRHHGFKLEERHVSFGTETIHNLIEKLDKKYDEWQKSVKKYYLFDDIEEDHEDHVFTGDVSELQKFQMLRNLAILDDVEVKELYQIIQSIIDNYKNNKILKSELLTSIPREKLPQNSDELISIISKDYTFEKFIGILKRDMKTNKLNFSKHFFEQRVKVRRDIKTQGFDAFFEDFKRMSGIEPINVIYINEHLFIFLSSENYFQAKRRFTLFKKKFRFLKIFFLREEKNFFNLIFSLFPDAYLHQIKVDYKKQTITIPNPTNNDQIEPEVLNELFNKYIVHSQPNYEFLMEGPKIE